MIGESSTRALAEIDDVEAATHGAVEERLGSRHDRKVVLECVEPRARLVDVSVW